MPQNYSVFGAKVAVRLEGGIGDHVLGLRLLPFVRARYPNAYITLFSDAGGSDAQADIARMSPFADEVRKIYHRDGAVRYETMGRLENVCEEDLCGLRAADYFFDAWGAGYYLAAARELGVPIYEILGTRPELRPVGDSGAEAEKVLASLAGRILVGMNVSKYGAGFLSCAGRLRELLAGILEDERVTVVNLYQTEFRYGHWPAEIAESRRAIAHQDKGVCEEINGWHPRIIPLTDLPLNVAAEVLRRCVYYVGVDNGMKHIAWAMGVPLTLYMPEMPSGEFVLRWIPDFHRVLLPTCSDDELASHVADARHSVSADSYR